MQQIRLVDGAQVSIKLVDQGDGTYALAVSPVDVVGGDTTNDVLKVAELCTLSTILTADGQIYTGVGTIVKFFVGNTHATETATIQLYDNTAASGDKLAGLINVPPVNGFREVTLNVPFANGIYADVTSGTVSMWATVRAVV